MTNHDEVPNPTEPELLTVDHDELTPKDLEEMITEDVSGEEEFWANRGYPWPHHRSQQNLLAGRALFHYMVDFADRHDIAFMVRIRAYADTPGAQQQP